MKDSKKPDRLLCVLVVRMYPNVESDNYGLFFQSQTELF